MNSYENDDNLSNNNQLKHYFETLSAQKLKKNLLHYIHDELIKNNESPLNRFLHTLQSYDDEHKKPEKQIKTKKMSLAIDIQYAMDSVYDTSERLDINLCSIIAEYALNNPLDGVWATDYGKICGNGSIAYYYIDDIENNNRIKTNCILYNIEDDGDMIFGNFIEASRNSDIPFIEAAKKKHPHKMPVIDADKIGHFVFKFNNNDDDAEEAEFVGSYRLIGSNYIGHWNGKKMDLTIKDKKFEKAFVLNENDKYLINAANEKIASCEVNVEEIKNELIQKTNEPPLSPDIGSRITAIFSFNLINGDDTNGDGDGDDNNNDDENNNSITMTVEDADENDSDSTQDID